MNITKTFALVSYSKAVLENYNPVVVKESNDIDLLEELDANDSPTAVSYTHLTLPTICSV